MTNHNENSCGCGDNHHENVHSCNCNEGNDDCACQHYDTNLSQEQISFLQKIAQHRCLPVAQFVVKSTIENDFESVALPAVFLNSPTDTMQEVKEFGEFLRQLENQGMLTLDYDMELKGYSYNEYHTSDLYKLFCKTVAEGTGQQGFLGDTPFLELGSMALTEIAEKKILN